MRYVAPIQTLACVGFKPMLPKLAVLLLSSAWLMCGFAQGGEKAAKPIVSPTFAMGALQLNNKTVTVEIADNVDRRTFGLMGRASLPQDTGMLFIFDEVTSTCFWMMDTPLPLSIGFFDEDGVLVSADDMQPFDEAHHCPKKPMKYALEMPQGWFADNQVKEGMRITLPQ
jgi:uncharacterized protein